MALSIKDEETDRLVRRYAALKGLSYTGAIRLAVSNALEGETPPTREAEVRERIRRIQASVAKLGVMDPRSPDEIVGYDEHGLPS